MPCHCQASGSPDLGEAQSLCSAGCEDYLTPRSLRLESSTSPTPAHSHGRRAPRHTRARWRPQTPAPHSRSKWGRLSTPRLPAEAAGSERASGLFKAPYILGMSDPLQTRGTASPVEAATCKHMRTLSEHPQNHPKASRYQDRKKKRTQPVSDAPGRRWVGIGGRGAQPSHPLLGLHGPHTLCSGWTRPAPVGQSRPAPARSV